VQLRFLARSQNFANRLGIEFAYPSLVRLSLLKMRRFSQIFTCAKWHLLSVHEPFYVVRFYACKVTGRYHSEADLKTSPRRGNSRQINKLGLAGLRRQSPTGFRGAAASTAGRIYTVVFQGFFKVGAIFCPRVNKQTEKRRAMELIK
jgi:hypothetical protein